MLENEILSRLNYIMNLYALGLIVDVEILESSQNKVYKVFNGTKYYVIKEFSNDAIKNYYHLNKRREQLKISYILSQNGIKTAKPIALNKKFFTLYKKHYYVVYNFLNRGPLKDTDLTIKHIKKLALTQSRIHKLKIEADLTCSYHMIDIDYDYYLKKLRKIDDKLYQVLLDNLDKLIDITNRCNRNIKVIKKNLCIGHNDYKLLNILWDGLDMTLIDFDATGYSNPTCSLCESAFTFSRIRGKINYDYYREYLKSYLKDYGVIEEDYRVALEVSFNGKLQWLSYMLSKNHLKRDNYLDGTISMIKELVLYYDNIDNFVNIYEEVK